MNFNLIKDIKLVMSKNETSVSDYSGNKKLKNEAQMMNNEQNVKVSDTTKAS